MHAEVRSAYNHWEVARQRSVNKVLEGMNRWTEHYSALQVEVPDPQDPASQLNQSLLDALLGFSNDMGLTPLQIVAKLTHCNGQPVAKLSDSPGKTLCDELIFLAYLRQVFGIHP